MDPSRSSSGRFSDRKGEQSDLTKTRRVSESKSDKLKYNQGKNPTQGPDASPVPGGEDFKTDVQNGTRGIGMSSGSKRYYKKSQNSTPEPMDVSIEATYQTVFDQSVGCLDPGYSAQDILRCHLCDAPVPPLCCDLCNINLCKACTGEHILDASKKHKVISMEQTLSEPIYPYCTKHSTKHCELYCEQCTIPICIQCVSSKEHKGHELEELVKYMESKKKNLKKDLQQMESSILTQYKEIASKIPFQKAYLRQTADSLKAAIDEHGKKLNIKVEVIVKKLKSKVEEHEEKQLSLLKEEDIARKISNIEEYIDKQKELQTSRDLGLIYEHKSRKEEFVNVPVMHNVTLPTFSANDIDIDQLLIQFGSLTDKTESDAQSEKPKEPVQKSFKKEPVQICFKKEPEEEYSKEPVQKSFKKEQVQICFKEPVQKSFKEPVQKSFKEPVQKSFKKEPEEEYSKYYGTKFSSR